MKRILMVALTVFLAGSPLTARKKQADRNLDPRIKQVHTIYVQGNSAAAQRIKELMSERTCFELSRNSKQSDAVMAVDENDRAGRGSFGASTNQTTVSAVINNQAGDELWSYSTRGDSNPFRSSASNAIVRLLDDLKRDACEAK